MAQIINISALETKQLQENTPNIKIFDVREVDEFEQGHIPNAINLPLSTWDDNHLANLSNADTVVFHCKSGGRTVVHAAKFVALDINKVYVLNTGFLAWQAAGFDVSR